MAKFPPAPPPWDPEPPVHLVNSELQFSFANTVVVEPTVINTLTPKMVDIATAVSIFFIDDGFDPVRYITF